VVGLASGTLYALNRAQIMNSVAGLREDLVAVTLLLLFGGIFVGIRRHATPSRLRLVGIGSAGAALVLNRGDMLVLAALVVTCGAVAMGWHWRHWLAAIVVLAVLSGPMYVGYAFTHGDAFYPGTYGATVNRNLEFPERMGTPGFPSPEEYAGDWAAGPRISPMKYFFGYHTVSQVIDYSIRGFIRIFPTALFTGERPLLGQPWGVWAVAAGSALLLITRKWLAPFAIVIGLAPFYAFLAGVPNPLVFAPRYALHVLPYAEIAVAYALCIVPLFVTNWWRSRPARSTA
jgi:hypothetical protein